MSTKVILWKGLKKIAVTITQSPQVGKPFIKIIMENNKVILLLSGGIDSTNLLAWLHKKGKTIYALSFDYGQKHMVELKFAQKNAKQFGVVEYKIVKIDNSLFKNSNCLAGPSLKLNSDNQNNNFLVPSRNMIFISYAISYAESIACNKIYADLMRMTILIFLIAVRLLSKIQIEPLGLKTIRHHALN